MTIRAKFASTCPDCGRAIEVGSEIEWERGSKARHTDCSIAAAAPAAAPVAVSSTDLTYETVGRRVYVRGNSYPFREAIKAAGGRWDAAEKAWWIGGAEKAEALKVALASATPAAPAPFRWRACKRCGARPNQRGWPRIYENGICSDCYRDEREEAEMGY